MRRARGLAAGGLVVGLAALTLCAPASAQIYWANQGTDTIGRADVDGMNVNSSFVTGPGLADPTGVVVDAAHVYWSHAGDAAATGNIGRAALDGTTNKDQTFITTASAPQGVGLDTANIYWTNIVSGAGKVGRAKVDGSSPNSSITSTLNTSPCGIASNGDRFYWANGGSPGSIGSSHGFGPDQSFITATNDPCGVALAEGFIYWTNRGDESIGRANLDGTSPTQGFIDTDPADNLGSIPCGLAVDEAHIYWGDQGTDKIGRADLDGSDPDPNFIYAGAGSDPCGFAVTPTQQATPSSQAFAETPIGSQSDIQSFFVADMSSSVLDVTDVSLIGPNPGDFDKTGDGCTINVAPATGGCVVNLRFAPTAEGDRSAILRVTSNASNSPTDIPLTGTATAPTPPPEPGPLADTDPPDTTIVAGPLSKTHKKRATFEFNSSEPGSSFECKLDDQAFLPCSSPQTLKVGKGRHTLEVRATDAAGNTDPTPATRSWTVKKKSKKKK